MFTPLYFDIRTAVGARLIAHENLSGTSKTVRARIALSLDSTRFAFPAEPCLVDGDRAVS